MSIDSVIDSYFSGVAESVANVIFYSVPLWDGGPELKLILLWLVAVGVFMTVYLGFMNVRYFGHAIDLLRGKYDDAATDGQINRFQALATSLSATVGLGNIAGVAIAVSLGGPGAVLWMMIMGLIGMSTKLSEITLSVRYRQHRDKNRPESISGGPMYYLKEGFQRRNIPYVGSFLAVVFCICCIGGSLGGGNMFQANQAYQQVYNVTGAENGFWEGRGWLFGIILAILVGLVILGGIKSIARVTSRIVPFMGIFYVGAGLLVIAMNIQQIPEAFAAMFASAFSLKAGLGGVIGTALAGVQRAAFSNEAGIGSAPIAHASSRTKYPVSQGIVAMLEPFIDTVIICAITGLVIVITGAYQFEDAAATEGVQLTSRAFESAIPGARYAVAFAVFLFAYSTLISWFYYADKSLTFLFGEKKSVRTTFKIIYCLFVVVGASSQLGSVILFTDSMIFAMAIPNVIGLYLLAPELRSEIKKYTKAIDKKTKSIHLDEKSRFIFEQL